jgi:hypothetical protein
MSRPIKNIGSFSAIIYSIILSIFLSSCINQHRPIDVSDSIYKSPSDNQTIKKQIRNINIINKADDGKKVHPLIDASYIPITPATTTKETVEQDIKRFLEENFISEKTGPTDITVTIQKADSYYIINSVKKIPYVNLITVFGDADFGMNLRVLFEVENKGKVVSSYLFDDQIITQGKIATEEGINQGYKKLISEYRKKFITELETRFINRYF